MVSLWPFRGKDGTPDAIEKKLSQLAGQIENHEKKLNGLRGRCRRLRALWTLYTVLIWAIYATILLLAVGINHASIESITGLVATPAVIYIVRQLLTTYYDWRTNGHESSLETLRAQQMETIEQLKSVTKYNSTQALLERYGASATGAKPEGDDKGKATQRKGSQPPPDIQVGPGGQPMPPPPPDRPQSQQGRPMSAQSHMSQMSQMTDMQGGPGGHMMPPPHMMAGGPPGMPGAVLPPAWEEPPREPQWYDRILDVLLGEDEMAAKSRFALICSNCRQVNGLAPPGTADVASVRFMCGRCGAENGKPDVKDIIGKVVAEERGGADTESDAAAGTPDERRRSKRSSKKKPGKAQQQQRRVVEEEEEEQVGGEASGDSSEEVVVVKKKKKSGRR